MLEEVIMVVWDQVDHGLFLREAQKVKAITEMALYYRIELICPEDFLTLIDAIKGNRLHEEALSWGIYFAPWIKKEVNHAKRIFKLQDAHCLATIKNGSSCVEILADCIKEDSLVSLMSELKNLNFIDKLLWGKGVRKA